jgi:hypothetical protein
MATFFTMEIGLATSSTSEKGDAKKSKRHYRFRMSLRLYSDLKQLGSIAETLKFPHERVDIKGEPMVLIGRLAGRIAKRHSVSFVETNTDDPNDLAPWIEENVAAIDALPAIVDDLRSKRVMATLWIAMFGETPTPVPTIPIDVVKQVADCGAQLFLENYTIMDPEHGNPQKHWITGAP